MGREDGVRADSRAKGSTGSSSPFPGFREGSARKTNYRGDARVCPLPKPVTHWTTLAVEPPSFCLGGTKGMDLFLAARTTTDLRRRAKVAGPLDRRPTSSIGV